MIPVLQSCLEVIKHSSVKIIGSGCSSIAVQIYEELRTEKAFRSILYSDVPVHPKQSNNAAVDWIFVVDTLNFCFWQPENKHWKVTWNEETYSGYFALCAAINKAIENGIDMTDPKIYSKLSLNEVKQILRGDDDTELLLLEERHQCLKESGKVLLEKFKGSFAVCVEECGQSAQTLLEIIITNFPSFRDEATYGNTQDVLLDKFLGAKCKNLHYPPYEGATVKFRADNPGSTVYRFNTQLDRVKIQRVVLHYKDKVVLIHHNEKGKWCLSFFSIKAIGFYKRAQILIGDIWSCFGGSGMGKFDDINTITMFADYRVPQVLLHYGALEYSHELLSILLKGDILKNGCKDEVEIRAASVVAVNQINKLVLDLLSQNNLNSICVNDILIDQYLWTHRRKIDEDLKNVPFHKVICIYY